jgi:hypothetical protein
MKRLCDAADLDIDSEYLKPHGGRRGLGSDLYAWNSELAQEFLQHESIAYSYASSSLTSTNFSSDCQRYSCPFLSNSLRTPSCIHPEGWSSSLYSRLRTSFREELRRVDKQPLPNEKVARLLLGDPDEVRHDVADQAELL